jgi:hypothetical protein
VSVLGRTYGRTFSFQKPMDDLTGMPRPRHNVAGDMRIDALKGVHSDASSTDLFELKH